MLTFLQETCKNTGVGTMNYFTHYQGFSHRNRFFAPAIYNLNPTRRWRYCMQQKLWRDLWCSCRTWGELAQLTHHARQGKVNAQQSSYVRRNWEEEEHETGSDIMVARITYHLQLSPEEGRKAGTGEMWKEELSSKRRQASAYHPHFGRWPGMEWGEKESFAEAQIVIRSHGTTRASKPLAWRSWARTGCASPNPTSAQSAPPPGRPWWPDSTPGGWASREAP